MPNIEVVLADLNLPEHQRAVIDLVEMYCRDPLGNGRELSAEARARLIPGLQQLPTTLILLAYSGRQPVGIALCFRGFSTFSARPLLNVHDLAVHPDFRGQGVGRLLLGEVARAAGRLGCVKITLEVYEDNLSARKLYESCGFEQNRHPTAGGSLFFSKPLS